MAQRHIAYLEVRVTFMRTYTDWLHSRKSGDAARINPSGLNDSEAENAFKLFHLNGQSGRGVTSITDISAWALRRKRTIQRLKTTVSLGGHSFPFYSILNVHKTYQHRCARVLLRRPVLAAKGCKRRAWE
jgi:hypothetical protein